MRGGVCGVRWYLRVLLLVQLIQLGKVDDEVDNKGGSSQSNEG